MSLFIPTILKYLPDWNKRIYTEADAVNFCDKNQIVTLTTDLIKDLGQYRMRKNTPFIFLHKFIDWRYRNWVFHHEIAHFILHPTTYAKFADAVTKRKIEKEANFVSAVALMPQELILKKSLFEIADEFNYPHPVILLRKEIFDSQGV